MGVSENDEKALIYENGRAYMPSDDDRKKCSKFVEFYANLAYAEDLKYDQIVKKKVLQMVSTLQIARQL